MVSIDGQEREVGAETAVFIPGNALHSLQNTADRPLRLVYVFPADSFDDITYVFA